MPGHGTNDQPLPGETPGGPEDETAGSAVVQELFERARAIAFTGVSGDLDGNVYHEIRVAVPGTKNTIGIVVYDEPSRRPGLEGWVAQVTWWENFGEPDILMGREYYAASVTAYLFFQIPDGLHVTRKVSSRPSLSRQPPVPRGPSSFDWAAFREAQRKAAADEADERAIGAHLFTREHSEQLRAQLDLGWPPDGPPREGRWPMP